MSDGRPPTGICGTTTYIPLADTSAQRRPANPCSIFYNDRSIVVVNSKQMRFKDSPSQCVYDFNLKEFFAIPSSMRTRQFNERHNLPPFPPSLHRLFIL
jgi:hypothetical protein